MREDEQICNGVEIVIGLLILYCIAWRRLALERHREVLAIRMVELGNTKAVLEHALRIRRLE
jgi:hypothetical protein